MFKRKDLQVEWENIVKRGSSKYNNLNKNEKIWFNLEPISNCGLIDHYINYGAEKNHEIIKSLEHLGLQEFCKLFIEVNELFKNKQPPKNIDKRNEEIYNWSSEKKETLERNEKLFWDKVSYLEEVLLIHINKNILDLP